MKIKVNEFNTIEGLIEWSGATPKQARTIGAVVRSVSADVLNGRDDTIRFCVNGQVWNLTLAKEQA